MRAGLQKASRHEASFRKFFEFEDKRSGSKKVKSIVALLNEMSSAVIGV